MKLYALRLRPNQDLKKELIKFTKENKIQSGFIITCVGSLRKATLRMADENIVKDYENRFEINSLSGTLCQDDVHLHVSLSDENGSEIGGHLKEGCIIYVTAEIVIGEAEDMLFSREFDKETGFNELEIRGDVHG
ncbi:MAG: DNA-binding protein [Candidatus Aenigmarchaeota archaeon]|nr:DNA-binding protein [Candidatus Aenigmarchaeota archaeon]